MSLGLATRGYTGTRGALGFVSAGYTPVVGPYVPPPPPPPEPIVEAPKKKTGRSSAQRQLQRDRELLVAARISSVNSGLPSFPVSGKQIQTVENDDPGGVSVKVIFENHDVRPPIVIIATHIKA